MSRKLSKLEQEKINAENQEIEYIHSYQKYLREEIMCAKGKDRTMAEFAKECNINPATLSRIVNGTIANPLKSDIIKKIVENTADPYVTYASLMRANGMIPKNDETPKSQIQREYNKKIRMNNEKIESIITQELFKRGFMVGPIIGTPFEKSDPFRKQSKFDLTRSFSFGLVVHGFECDYWHFSRHYFTGEEEYEDSDEYKRELLFEARSMIGTYTDVFLRDIWEPEAFENCKYSIVLVNQDLFDEFSKIVKKIKVYHDFSLILVDIQKEEVVKEMIFARYDQKIGQRIFDNEKYVTINENDNINDMNKK